MQCLQCLQCKLYNQVSSKIDVQVIIVIFLCVRRCSVCDGHQKYWATADSALKKAMLAAGHRLL